MNFEKQRGALSDPTHRTGLALGPRFSSGGQIISLWAAIFFIFCLYGPAFNLFGEFRYVEVVVIAITVPMLSRAWAITEKTTRTLIYLLILTAASQILSDILNDVYAESTIKRVGTYLIFILVILSCKLMSLNDWTTIRIIVLAYTISWVFTYFVGTSAAPNYQITPWRLGMGAAFTLAVCTFLSFTQNLSPLKLLVLVPVALLHVILGSRSIALFTMITLLVTLIAIYRGRAVPRETSTSRFTVTIVAIFSGVFILYYGLIAATEFRLFPQEVQQRTEAQVYSQYGLAATARPETAAAVLAIAEKPLFGWGSTAYDPIIWRYYVDVLTANWATRTDYDNIYRDTIYQEWDGGLPSHSHVLGAWTDGGFLASLSWFYVIGLSLYLFIQCLDWRNNAVPLATFVASTTIWDVAFSPGPHRMDMAIKLLIITFLIQRIKQSRSLLVEE